MNSPSPNIVNSEPIEHNFNGIFANNTVKDGTSIFVSFSLSNMTPQTDRQTKSSLSMTDFEVNLITTFSRLDRCRSVAEYCFNVKRGSLLTQT
jgi:hypothetical protein